MADSSTWDKILATRLRYEVVEVPEFGASVWMWELSALQKLQIVSGGDDSRAAMVRLIAASMGDETGPRGFPVENLSSDVVDRLYPAAIRLLSKRTGEEQRGNSQGGPTGDSPTGSP